VSLNQKFMTNFIFKKRSQ